MSSRVFVRIRVFRKVNILIKHPYKNDEKAVMKNYDRSPPE
jgi:hypothetical protein